MKCSKSHFNVFVFHLENDFITADSVAEFYKITGIDNWSVCIFDAAQNAAENRIRITSKPKSSTQMRKSEFLFELKDENPQVEHFIAAQLTLTK